jgi:hypothetical protein
MFVCNVGLYVYNGNRFFVVSRISAVLQQVGMPLQSLSDSGIASLQILARLSVLLGTKDASNSRHELCKLTRVVYGLIFIYLHRKTIGCRLTHIFLLVSVCLVVLRKGHD